MNRNIGQEVIWGCVKNKDDIFALVLNVVCEHS